MRIPDTLVPARDGDWLMITTGNGYWAKGEDIRKAKVQLRNVAGSRDPKAWRVRSIHPDTFVNEDGGISSKIGHSPLTIAEWDPS